MIAKRVLPRRLLNGLADWQILPVGLIAPVLVFPTYFPRWLVVLALAAIPILWLLHRLARGRWFLCTPADLPLLILLLTLPVGLWASALPDLSLPEVIKYLIAIALFYALVNTLTTSRKVILAGWAVLAGTALVATLSLLGTAWGGGSKFLPGNLAAHIPRLFDAFWNPKGFSPNIVGGILAMWVPVTVASG